ncbi:MAG: hypothetical protein J7L53_03405 [Deltaproteobacteria bacterium]|nr:hypothetical protein [Deltaproteobacteria bacterium]
MKDKERKSRELCHTLIDTAQRLGIEVIEDKIDRKGGVCRVDDKIMVIYDISTLWTDRVKLILKALGWMKLDDVYLSPKIRQLLEDKGQL